MTLHNTTKETPYFLAFGVETVVPVEKDLLNYRTTHFFQEKNDDVLRSELDLLEEKQEVASLWAAAYK